MVFKWSLYIQNQAPYHGLLSSVIDFIMFMCNSQNVHTCTMYGNRLLCAVPNAYPLTADLL